MRTISPGAARPATLRRIPSLDGLRAVSIIMVMGLHSIERMETHHPVALIWPVVFNGGLGVSVFFVLSGMYAALPAWQSADSLAAAAE